jgi:hypothetical protein
MLPAAAKGPVNSNMRTCIIAPDCSLQSGLKYWVERFWKATPGHDLTVISGMTPLMQQRTGTAHDGYIRQRFQNKADAGAGYLEMVYAPMVWPFLSEKGRQTGEYQYPTVAPDTYQNLFDRILNDDDLNRDERRKWPDVTTGLNVTEYDARNLVTGFCRSDDSRTKHVLVPYTTFDTPDIFPDFDEVVFLHEEQQNQWATKVMQNGGAPSVLNQIDRAQIVPPFLDAIQARSRRNSRKLVVVKQNYNPAELTTNTHRVGLLATALWGRAQAIRVVDFVVSARALCGTNFPIQILVPDTKHLTASVLAEDALDVAMAIGRPHGITFTPMKWGPAQMLDLAQRVAHFVLLPRAEIHVGEVSSVAGLELINASIPFVTTGDPSTPILSQDLAKLASALNGHPPERDPVEDIELLADLGVYSGPTQFLELLHDLTPSSRLRLAPTPAAQALKLSPAMYDAVPKLAIDDPSKITHAPDAYFIMDTGNPQAVLAGVSAASVKNRPAYIMCSNGIEYLVHQAAYGNDANVTVVNMEWFEGVKTLNLACDLLSIAEPHLRDLARKRNAAILIAAAMGYEIIANCDNDVHGDETTDIADATCEGATILHHHRHLQSVGIPYGKDKKTQDHCFWRFATTELTDLAEKYGIESKSFYGGGLEVLRVIGSDPFPAMYNDDWYHVIRAMCEGALALLKHNVNQLPPMALAHVKRVEWEEIGDWIAETIMRRIIENPRKFKQILTWHASGDPDDRMLAYAALRDMLELSLGPKFAERVDLIYHASDRYNNEYDYIRVRKIRTALIQSAEILQTAWPDDAGEWFLSCLDAGKAFRTDVKEIVPIKAGHISQVVEHLGGRYSTPTGNRSPFTQVQARNMRKRITDRANGSSLPEKASLLPDKQFEFPLTSWPLPEAAIDAWLAISEEQPQTAKQWDDLTTLIAEICNPYFVHPTIDFDSLPQSAPEAARVARLNMMGGPLHPSVRPWIDDIAKALSDAVKDTDTLPPEELPKRLRRNRHLYSMCICRAVDYSLRVMIRDRLLLEQQKIEALNLDPSFATRFRIFKDAMTARATLPDGSLVLTPERQPLLPIGRLLNPSIDLLLLSKRALEPLFGTTNELLNYGYEHFNNALGNPANYQPERDYPALQDAIRNVVEGGYSAFYSYALKARDSGHDFSEER